MSHLFTGTGYFLFSGVFNFGDWAAVISGLEPHWMWQAGLVVVGVISYYGSMRLVANALGAFGGTPGESRLRVLCWTPYITVGILAGLGGLLNPIGLFYVLASALPSTLGANAGLLSLPGLMRIWGERAEKEAAAIQRSWGWIAAGAVAAVVFVVVLGRGVSWER